MIIIQTTATPSSTNTNCKSGVYRCGASIINAAAAVAQSGLLPPSHVQATAPAARKIQPTWMDNLDGGDLSVSAAAALVSTRGMSILIDDMRALYVANRATRALYVANRATRALYVANRATRALYVANRATRALYVANRAKGKAHWPSI